VELRYAPNLSHKFRNGASTQPRCSNDHKNNKNNKKKSNESKMRSHNAMKEQEAENAGWEATRGAVYGAVKWGAVTAALGGAGHALSPIYRGLTIQFKV
jgi:hypothetical protein